MVTKKRGRYEVSDKGKMIHELDKHLHLKGPNIPNQTGLVWFGLANQTFIWSLKCKFLFLLITGRELPKQAKKSAA